MSTSELSETIEKFIEAKAKIGELEKKHEKYRKIIEEYMFSQSLSEIKHTDKVSIKKSMSTRETISKKDLPPDIWEKYCKISRFTTITLKHAKK